MDVEPAPALPVAAVRQDFDCPVCHELLYKPCIPSCGHPFCKACLCELLSHKSTRAFGSGGAKCPVCRRVLHVTRGEDLAVCSQFDNLLALSFPDEHRARGEATDALAAAAEQARERLAADSVGLRERLPLFVMDATLPRQHLHINVFEPRYVGMVQRALQGSRCFGMVGFGTTRSGMASQGVEVSILQAAEQWDGRFHLEVVGHRPFTILMAETRTDGLIEADVEYFDLEAGGSEGDVVEAVASDVPRLVQEWQDVVQQGGWERHPGHINLIREHLGPMPPVSRPGALACWVIALINPLPPLGVAQELRPALLAARSPLERVELAVQGLRSSTARLHTLERSWLVQVAKYLPGYWKPMFPAVLVVFVAVLTQFLS